MHRFSIFKDLLGFFHQISIQISQHSISDSSVIQLKQSFKHRKATSPESTYKLVQTSKLIGLMQANQAAIIV